MTHSRTLTALLAVPVLSLAACGGSGNSDKDSITKIINDTTKNPASVCDHLDAPVLKALGGASGCKTQAKAAGNGNKADIGSIDIKGAKATAHITAAGKKQTIMFVKKSGAWFVTTG